MNPAAVPVPAESPSGLLYFFGMMIFLAFMAFVFWGDEIFDLLRLLIKRRETRKTPKSLKSKITAAIPRIPDSARAVCACEHAYGKHLEGQQCLEEVKRESDWLADGTPFKWEYVQCKCQRYVGPEPVEIMGQMVMPSLAEPINITKKKV